MLLYLLLVLAPAHSAASAPAESYTADAALGRADGSQLRGSSAALLGDSRGRLKVPGIALVIAGAALCCYALMLLVAWRRDDRLTREPRMPRWHTYSLISKRRRAAAALLPRLSISWWLVRLPGEVVTSTERATVVFAAALLELVVIELVYTLISAPSRSGALGSVSVLGALAFVSCVPFAVAFRLLFSWADRRVSLAGLRLAQLDKVLKRALREHRRSGRPAAVRNISAKLSLTGGAIDFTSGSRRGSSSGLLSLKEPSTGAPSGQHVVHRLSGGSALTKVTAEAVATAAMDDMEAGAAGASGGTSVAAGGGHSAGLDTLALRHVAERNIKAEEKEERALTARVGKGLLYVCPPFVGTYNSARSLLSDPELDAFDKPGAALLIPATALISIETPHGQLVGFFAHTERAERAAKRAAARAAQAAEAAAAKELAPASGAAASVLGQVRRLLGDSGDGGKASGASPPGTAPGAAVAAASLRAGADARLAAWRRAGQQRPRECPALRFVQVKAVRAAPSIPGEVAARTYFKGLEVQEMLAKGAAKVALVEIVPVWDEDLDAFPPTSAYRHLRRNSYEARERANRAGASSASSTSADRIRARDVHFEPDQACAELLATFQKHRGWGTQHGALERFGLGGTAAPSAVAEPGAAPGRTSALAAAARSAQQQRSADGGGSPEGVAAVESYVQISEGDVASARLWWSRPQRWRVRLAWAFHLALILALCAMLFIVAFYFSGERHVTRSEWLRAVVGGWAVAQAFKLLVEPAGALPSCVTMCRADLASSAPSGSGVHVVVESPSNPRRLSPARAATMAKAQRGFCGMVKQHGVSEAQPVGVSRRERKVASAWGGFGTSAPAALQAELPAPSAGAPPSPPPRKARASLDARAAQEWEGWIASSSDEDDEEDVHMPEPHAARGLAAGGASAAGGGGMLATAATLAGTAVNSCAAGLAGGARPAPMRKSSSTATLGILSEPPRRSASPPGPDPALWPSGKMAVANVVPDDDPPPAGVPPFNYLLTHSVAEERRLAHLAALFNREISGRRAVHAVVSSGGIASSPEAVAAFFKRAGPRLSARLLLDFVRQSGSSQALVALMKLLDFRGLPLDSALRKLGSTVELQDDIAMMEKVLAAFSQR